MLIVLPTRHLVNAFYEDTFVMLNAETTLEEILTELIPAMFEPGFVYTRYSQTTAYGGWSADLCQDGAILNTAIQRLYVGLHDVLRSGGLLCDNVMPCPHYFERLHYKDIVLCRREQSV